MTRTYKTGLLITGDAKGGVRAVQLTQKELGKLGATGKKVGEQLKHVGDSLKNVGRTMSTRVTAPIAAAGVGILKSAGDFEAAMNRKTAPHICGCVCDLFRTIKAMQTGEYQEYNQR